jgi:hypothetical protein
VPRARETDDAAAYDGDVLAIVLGRYPHRSSAPALPGSGSTVGGNPAALSARFTELP